MPASIPRSPAVKMPSLIHRGYLYAQKYVPPVVDADGKGVIRELPGHTSHRRMTHAQAWKQGYLTALREIRDAKKA